MMVQLSGPGNEPCRILDAAGPTIRWPPRPFFGNVEILHLELPSDSPLQDGASEIETAGKPAG